MKRTREFEYNIEPEKKNKRYILYENTYILEGLVEILYLDISKTIPINSCIFLKDYRKYFTLTENTELVYPYIIEIKDKNTYRALLLITDIVYNNGLFNKSITQDEINLIKDEVDPRHARYILNMAILHNRTLNPILKVCYLLD